MKPIRKKLTRSLQLIVLGIFFLTGCAGINLFSTSQEVRMGRSLSLEVDRQYPILQNPELVDYVNRVGQKIVSVCDRKGITYHFKIIDDSRQVNAFALPGGYIYVYMGLLKAAENEAELAAVLGHEVGHVVARHATERLTKLYGYSFLVSLVLGENPAYWQELVANLFGTMGMLKFSRDDEFEADRLGATYIYRAGYNPKAMIGFFERLKTLRDREPSKLETLLSTHPPPRDRIRKVEKVIETLPPKTD